MPTQTREGTYSLDAAVALYEREPELRDIYVEGRRDVHFYSWYLTQVSCEAHVYAVDDRLNIPSEYVSVLGLDTNARGRAAAFAAYCERTLGRDQRAVTVIVDADLSRVVGPMQREQSCLFMTDDTSLECYALQRRPMAKFLRVAVGSSADPDGVITAIKSCLMDILAVRCVLKEYDLALVDDFTACCRFKPDPGADVPELIRRSLGRLPKRSWPSSLDLLIDAAATCRESVRRSGQSGRGHDIGGLLRVHLGLGQSVGSNAAIEAALLTALEVEDLRATKLFTELEARLAPLHSV